MFGKNNYQERLRNMTKQTKQDQFSIRKLSIGAMAVLLSFTFLANCHTAKADTVTPNSETDSSANKQTAKANQSKLTTYSGLSSFFKTQDENKPHVQSSLDAESTSNNSRNVAAESVKAKNELSQNNKITKDDEAPTTPDTPSHIHNGKWNNIDAAYNDETKELTLTGGTDTEPALMSPNQGEYQLQSLYAFLSHDLGSTDFSRDVKQITINGKIKAQGHAKELFSNLVNLTTIEGLTNLDTSDVTDMWHMFAMDASLTSLDLSGFNTSKVTNMDSMFINCSSLTNLDVSHFDTSNVTNMGAMFASCSSLTNLDVSRFNTSKVNDIGCLFYGCKGLTSLNLSNFVTSNVTDMNGMFFACSGLTSLDVSSFDTSNVTDMNGTFFACSGLTKLDVSHFNTSKVTNMNGMFFGCKSLTNIDVSHFATSLVTDMGGMFKNCSNLTNLNLSSFNTSHVTNMTDMFEGCSKLQQLSLGKEFKFLQGSKLEELPGKWINWGIINKKLPKGTNYWSSKEFTKNYKGATDYDMYVCLTNMITIQYRDQNGKKIPNVADEVQYGNIGDPLIDKTNPKLPNSYKRKDIPDYQFDHAEIDGKKVDLANIKYTEKAQTITLFYTRIYSGDGGSAGSAGASNAANSSNPNNSKDSGNQSDSKGSSIAENTKNVTLKHNAYLYDSNARHFTGVILSAGSVIASYGIKTVKGQQYYVLKDKGDNNKNYYVSVGNAKPVVHKLKHSARVYNKYGQRIKGAGVLKRGRRINTFGNPVTIRGCQYFVIDKGRFAKVVNFALTSSKKTVATVGVKAGSTKSNVIDKTIMHNAYLYDNKGNRNNGIIILAGSKIGTSGLKKLNGKLYYALVDGMYIAADNINYNKKKLKHRAYVYNQYGNHSSKKLLKKGKSIKTYGKAVTIKHKKYYTVARNEFIKKANFR